LASKQRECKGNYKIVVTHDIPEDSQDNDRELLVDIDSIKFKKGDSDITIMAKSRHFLVMANLNT
jgi:hypothetical protein